MVARVAYNEIPELFLTTGDQQELAIVQVIAMITHAVSRSEWAQMVSAGA